MRFGLKEELIKSLGEIFDKYDKIDRVVVFGSRAKGNFKSGSDIDLAIFGKDIDLRYLHDLEVEIDDLLLPYEFDFVIFENIKDNELKKHIERVGESFWERRGL